MASLFEQIQRLFTNSGNKGPEIHEPLNRSDRFLRDQAAWDAASLLQLLKQEYQLNLLGNRSDTFIRLESPVSSGFRWQAVPTTESDYDHLADYFKQILLKQDYRLYHADRKIKSVGEMVVELQRIYLKPRMRSETTDGEPLDQKWGNLLIEVHRANGKVVALQLQANVYHDRIYAPHRSFDSLMEFLLA